MHLYLAPSGNLVAWSDALDTLFAQSYGDADDVIRMRTQLNPSVPLPAVCLCSAANIDTNIALVSEWGPDAAAS